MNLIKTNESSRHERNKIEGEREMDIFLFVY